MTTFGVWSCLRRGRVLGTCNSVFQFRIAFASTNPSSLLSIARCRRCTPAFAANCTHMCDINGHSICVPGRRWLISAACSSHVFLHAFPLARAHRRPVGAAATTSAGPCGCIASACLLTIRFRIASGGTAGRVAALSVIGTRDAQYDRSNLPSPAGRSVACRRRLARASGRDWPERVAGDWPERVAGDWPWRVAGAPWRVAGAPPRVAGAPLLPERDLGAPCECARAHGLK